MTRDKPRKLVWSSWVPDRLGTAFYVHLIRGPDDPKAPPRVKGADPNAWREVNKVPVQQWGLKIIDVLSDGKPRTFNAIAMSICGRTADVVFDKNPDKALWDLLEHGVVQHTVESPIYWRLAPTGPWQK